MNVLVNFGLFSAQHGLAGFDAAIPEEDLPALLVKFANSSNPSLNLSIERIVQSDGHPVLFHWKDVSIMTPAVRPTTNPAELVIQQVNRDLFNTIFDATFN